MKTNEDNVQNEVALIDCLHVIDERLAQYLYQEVTFGSQLVCRCQVSRVLEHSRAGSI